MARYDLSQQGLLARLHSVLLIKGVRLVCKVFLFLIHFLASHLDEPIFVHFRQIEVFHVLEAHLLLVLLICLQLMVQVWFLAMLLLARLLQGSQNVSRLFEFVVLRRDAGQACDGGAARLSLDLTTARSSFDEYFFGHFAEIDRVNADLAVVACQSLRQNVRSTCNLGIEEPLVVSRHTNRSGILPQHAQTVMLHGKVFIRMRRNLL